MSGTLALVPAGLLTQTQEEIVDELGVRLRARFGKNLNLSVASIMGQIANIVSELRAYDQQVLLAAYRSFDPNGAIGQALDRICNITGTIRKGSRPSTVSGLFTFTAAGIVSDGDLFRNADTDTIWIASGGPFVAVGPSSVVGSLVSVDSGPLLAQAGTTWANVSVIPNLTGFTNPTDDANQGRLEESDPDLRVRRQIEIFSRGSGPRAALRAVVSKVEGVDTVRVDHNPNIDPVDSEGIPFKAFRVSVETTPSPPPVALQQAIGDAMFSAMGAGGSSFGTDYSVDVVDIEGEIETMSFDLIDVVPVYVSVTITTTGTEQVISSTIASVVAAQILETALSTFRDIGRDQLAGEYAAIVWGLKQAGQITGVTGVSVQLSRTSLLGPFADPLVIGKQERPAFDSPNIEVTIA
jgi:hypothetical protein